MQEDIVLAKSDSRDSRLIPLSRILQKGKMWRNCSEGLFRGNPRQSVEITLFRWCKCPRFCKMLQEQLRAKMVRANHYLGVQLKLCLLPCKIHQTQPAKHPKTSILKEMAFWADVITLPSATSGVPGFGSLFNCDPLFCPIFSKS